MFIDGPHGITHPVYDGPVNFNRVTYPFDRQTPIETVLRSDGTVARHFTERQMRIPFHYGDVVIPFEFELYSQWRQQENELDISPHEIESPTYRMGTKDLLLTSRKKSLKSYAFKSKNTPRFRYFFSARAGEENFLQNGIEQSSDQGYLIFSGYDAKILAAIRGIVSGNGIVEAMGIPPNYYDPKDRTLEFEDGVGFNFEFFHPADMPSLAGRDEWTGYEYSDRTLNVSTGNKISYSSNPIDWARIGFTLSFDRTHLRQLL